MDKLQRKGEKRTEDKDTDSGVIFEKERKNEKKKKKKNTY